MSLPLLRQVRIPASLSATCRAASRTRCYSAAAVQTQTRSERESPDDAQVAGPSSQRAGEASDRQKSKSALLGRQDADEPSETFSRVQSYLASINASGLEPTLEDLERCRPHRQPSPDSEQYVEKYTELVNTLCRSFTKEQLRGFLVQTLGTSRHCATNRKKVEYAESIIEQLWKWPTLKEVEKARRDRTEVVTQTLPVTASELFLILGREGMDLLRLSKDYDVHISLRQKPMALRVEGTRSSLRKLTEHINSLKKSFIEATFDLPLPVAIPPDLVQRISRIASAYLENVPSSPGKVRIVAQDERGLQAAKRLASRAIHEIEESSRTPLLTYLPAGAASLDAEQLVMFPHDYALYPYLSPRPLPFTMNTSGVFRLRRVGQWLASDFRENVQETGGLAGGYGHVVTVSEERVNLKETLLSKLPELEQLDRSHLAVFASMGHILLTRPSGEQRATLVPPLTGEHKFGKVHKWIAQNPVKMTFVPDLPLPLLNTSPAKEGVKHRLVYHTLSAGSDTSSSPLRTPWRKVIALELTITEPQANHAEQPARPVPLEGDLEDGLSDRDLDFDLDYVMNGTLPPSRSTPPPAEPPIPTLDASGVHCWTGIEADFNVMIPDRPMDLQFTVRSSTTAPEAQQPAELRQYVEQLRAFLQGSPEQTEQPSPPLLIEYGGERYILHSNSSVRQSEEMVSDFGRPTAHELGAGTLNLTRALCESTLDLETNQKSMHCEVVCEDVASDQAWTRFLRDCDRLSVMREEQRKTVDSILNDFNDIL
ncbi:hypothetical protein OH77DRAFT_1585401 [Trametes cingulata]|nr:hypothetical protein OH77DRAFT_1585401 [Trametes cingulata]